MNKGIFSKLKAVGVDEQQAEVQAEALADIIDDQLATKQDLKETELALIKEMKELEFELKREMATNKLDVVRWVVGSSMALMSAMFVMLRFFPSS